MAAKGWVFDPGSGGKKIPKDKQDGIRQRIIKYADENYAENLRVLMCAFAVSSVILMRIPNRLIPAATRFRSRESHAKHIWKDYAIRPLIFADSYIVETLKHGAGFL